MKVKGDLSTLTRRSSSLDQPPPSYSVVIEAEEQQDLPSYEEVMEMATSENGCVEDSEEPVSKVQEEGLPSYEEALKMEEDHLASE